MNIESEKIDELNDIEPALIFIPDISGFTEFMNETEFMHSRHLIPELLEVIIDANVSNMNVAEIQGDAVLFYKLGPPPTLEAIVNQAKKMFFDFQYYLKIIERDSICQCGACLSKSPLTLKIIVHYGKVSFTKIQNYIKLIGKDVIIAHRLLKNNITEKREYLLLSEQFVQYQTKKAIKKYINWAELQKGSIEYEHLGKINYDFVSLSPLTKVAATPPQLRAVKKYRYSLNTHLTINAPIHFVHLMLIDLKHRTKWMYGLKNIIFDNTKIQRVGTTYKAAFGKRVVDIYIVQNMFRDDEVEYVEKLADFKMFPNAMMFYTLIRKGEKTDFKLEFSYTRLPATEGKIKKFIKKKLSEQLKKTAEKFKKFCETHAAPKSDRLKKSKNK